MPGSKTSLLVLSLLFATISPRKAFAATDPAIDKILPLPTDVRKILKQRCILCHGELVNGGVETREDLDLSTDATIRKTLEKAGRLKQMILEEKMPQKAKLSMRLRKDPKLQERLAAIKSGYALSGEKERLLAWLKDVVATTGEKDD